MSKRGPRSDTSPQSQRKNHHTRKSEGARRQKLMRYQEEEDKENEIEASQERENGHYKFDSKEDAAEPQAIAKSLRPPPQTKTYEPPTPVVVQN